MDVGELRAALAKKKKNLDDMMGAQAELMGFDPADTGGGRTFYTGNFVDKSPCGKIGLLNQGATCYLNSLIQSLYMTPEFRAALYEWEYNAEIHGEEKRCMPLQLQKLFSSLQLSSRGAVSTKGLTTSFGWTGNEMYVQHDVVELANVMFEFLEQQCVGTKIQSLVTDDYRAVWEDYVECMNCMTFRGRSTPYVGLSLDINAANTLDEAMRAFITPETLDGGNQYMCSICDSKQDAKKGIRFTTFPYFLSIQLRRWTLNWQTFTRVKVHKAVSFPMSFDPTVYLDDRPIEIGSSDETDGATAPSGPQEYELYSMMIHTGGAMGGHYFAYIKDFATGEWFHFNDSRVEKITEEQMEQMFTVEEPKDDKKQDEVEKVPAPLPANQQEAKNALEALLPMRKAPESKPAVEPAPAPAPKPDDPSATEERKEDTTTPAAPKVKRMISPIKAAYMLMYRRVDPDKNLNGVTDEMIPQSRKDEVAADDEIYLDQLAEYKRQQQLFTLSIICEAANIRKHVKVQKGEPLRNAVDNIYETLQLQEKGIARDCIRIRNYNGEKQIATEPFEEQLDVNVIDLGFKQPKIMFLEVKEPDGEFVVYEPQKMIVRMKELDVEAMEYKESVEIFVEEEGPVGGLREACAEAMGCGAEQVRLVFQVEEIAILLEDDTKPIKEHRIGQGDTILVEQCENHLNGNSPLLSHIDKLLNQIDLRFNNFLPEGPCEVVYDQFITVDVRQPLKEVRLQLAEYLGVGPEEFKIRKNFNDKELKSGKKTLNGYNIGVNGHVFVERGVPLKFNEFLFQIFIEDEIVAERSGDAVDEEHKSRGAEPYLYIGDCVLDKRWDMAQVKEKLATMDNTPDPEYMRIRDYSGNRLKDVFYDDKILSKNCRGIKDFKQIVIQKTARVETFTSNDILVNVARWYPEAFTLAPAVEFAFSKNMLIKSELIPVIQEISEIDPEHLRVAHPRNYELKPKKRKQLCVLDWDMVKLNEASTLAASPWKMNSGDYIIYKDNREQEKYQAEEETALPILRNNPNDAIGIVFYTPEQQLEREAEQERKRQEQAEQLDKTKREAIERLNENASAAAQEAAKMIEKSMDTSADGGAAESQ